MITFKATAHCDELGCEASCDIVLSLKESEQVASRDEDYFPLIRLTMIEVTLHSVPEHWTVNLGDNYYTFCPACVIKK
jgi:hypothetical protein